MAAHKFESFILVLALAAGCASAPVSNAPRYTPRTMTAYECRHDSWCATDHRCYRRFPSDVGRCVTDDYYARKPRYCRFDTQCERTETCRRNADEPDRHGTCTRTYVSETPTSSFSANSK